MSEGWTYITTQLSSWASWLQARLSEGIAWLGSELTSKVSWLRDRIGEGWTYISGRLGDFAAGISNTVSKGLQDLGGSVKTAFDGAVQTATSWVQDALKGVAGALGEGLQSFWTALTGTLGSFAQNLTGFLSEKVVAPLASGLTSLGGWLVSSVRDVFSRVLALFSRPRAIDPKDPMASAGEILATMAGFTMSMALPILAGELVHPLKQVGLNQLSAIMYDLGGFGRVAGALTYEMADASYLAPLGYILNQTFRPRIPSTILADQMLFEGHITDAEWRDIYQKHGWKDSYIDAWARTVWREPSQRVLLNLLADPDMPEDWIRRKLKETGLRGEDQDALIAYGRRLALSDERKALITQAETDYVDGVIDEAQFRADLGALKLSTAEIDLRAEKCLLIRDRKARREALKPVVKIPESEINAVRTQVAEDYVAGSIDESQMRANLKATDMDPDVLDFRVEAAKLRRARNERAQRVAAYKTEYLRGGITPAEAITDLQAYGFTREEATSTVQDWETIRKPIKITETKKPTDEVQAQWTLNERWLARMDEELTEYKKQNVDVAEPAFLVDQAKIWQKLSGEELKDGRVAVALDFAEHAESLLKSGEASLRSQLLKMIRGATSA
jgi:hypothetical protein